MELKSISELRNRRKRLEKLLEATLHLARTVNSEVPAAAIPDLREMIADIDTEIEERTAGERGIADASN